MEMSLRGARFIEQVLYVSFRVKTTVSVDVSPVRNGDFRANHHVSTTEGWYTTLILLLDTYLFDNPSIDDPYQSSPNDYHNVHITPWKINIEPTNHQFRKENDLKQTSRELGIMFHVDLPGCIILYIIWIKT